MGKLEVSDVADVAEILEANKRDRVTERLNVMKKTLQSSADTYLNPSKEQYTDKADQSNRKHASNCNDHR